ncbi:MAG: TatD family hydrolase [Moraxellaceae bacterium]|nr:TatD family hydrolase [Moraxellaceae bacterium]
MALIDTHLHLDAAEFDGDREAVIARARSAGVTRLVLPAVLPANFDAVRDLARRLPGSVHAYGIHPLYVGQVQESDIAVLEARLAEGDAVAVGEIGLDGYEAEPDPARQEWFFNEQLRLAKRFDLPVILHVRRAQDRVLKYLRRHGLHRGIAHAFNGSPQQAQAFIDQGFKLGFGGAMTFSGSTRIRALAASLPLQAIVLESDGPDIRPAWAQDVPNEPANVARFAEELAGLRGISSEEVARITTANACEALRLN